MTDEKIMKFRSLIRVLERELSSQMESDTVCCGVTLTQCHILMELQLGKTVSVKELSQSLDLDKSTMSRAVDSMVKKGLLIREEDPDDRRFSSIRLSRTGLKKASDINGQCNPYYRALFELLPTEKHAMIFESMELIGTAMNQIRKSTASCACSSEKIRKVKNV